MSLTDETSSTIDVAAGLTIPGFSKVEGARKTTSTEKAEYRLTYRIEFPSKTNTASKRDPSSSS
jgi:hypothetical protein